MIFGIGTDVVQLARVEDVYARHGEHFVRRLLLPEEEAGFRNYKRPVRFLAMRLAADERDDQGATGVARQHDCAGRSRHAAAPAG